MIQKTLDTTVKQLLVLAAVSHHWHLQTSSYPWHMALGELYTLSHEAADQLSESAQGHGFPRPAPTKVTIGFSDAAQAAPEIKSVIAQLGKLDKEAGELCWLSNIAQEIQADLLKIVYKLERLS